MYQGTVTVSSEALMYLYYIDCKLMLKPLWASVVDPVSSDDISVPGVTEDNI